MTGYADLVAAAVTHAVSVERCNLAGLSPARSARLGTLKMIAAARRTLRSVDADLVHVVDGSHAHVLRWLRPDLPVVVTVHDLIPLLQCRGRFDVRRPGLAARWLIGRS